MFNLANLKLLLNFAQVRICDLAICQSQLDIRVHQRSDEDRIKVAQIHQGQGESPHWQRVINWAGYWPLIGSQLRLSSINNSQYHHFNLSICGRVTKSVMEWQILEATQSFPKQVITDMFKTDPFYLYRICYTDTFSLG